MLFVEENVLFINGILSRFELFLLFFNFLFLLFVLAFILDDIFFCSSCLSEGEQAAKLLKITWMIFPFGVIAAIPACLVIFCSQAISYSDPRGKAILIYGNLFSSSNFSLAFFKLHAFSVIKCCLVIIVLLLPSGCNLSIVYLKTQKEGGDMFDNFCSLKKKKKKKN